MATLPTARYTFGGDEHVFVEISDEMSLPAFFKVMAITNALRSRKVSGISEICPGNAAYLVRFDPDVLAPDDALALLQEVEASLVHAAPLLATRLIEIPVYYDDPWTRETLMRFRERHQDPNSTDLEYAARINGKSSIAEFIAAHSGAPWFVSMVGFVAGLPFLFQMVERAQQLEAPKYLRPRTDTPRLTIGHGGCFSCIYSVRGAGGYQMFGITPAPIFDPAQKLPYLKDGMCLFRPGDIVKWRPISRVEYVHLRAAADAGTLELRQRKVDFSLTEFLANPAAYNARLMAQLN